MPNGFKKHQLNIFVGSQSYIFRVNSIKQVKSFTGLKTVNAKTVADFLSRLNDQVFDTELGGSYKKAVSKAKKKKMKQAKNKQKENLKDQMNLDLGIEEKPDYLKQVKARLVKLGAKTEKQALKILKQKTGIAWKNFKKIKPKDAQLALAYLLRGTKK